MRSARCFVRSASSSGSYRASCSPVEAASSHQRMPPSPPSCRAGDEARAGRGQGRTELSTADDGVRRRAAARTCLPGNGRSTRALPMVTRGRRSPLVSPPPLPVRWNLTSRDASADAAMNLSDHPEAVLTQVDPQYGYLHDFGSFLAHDRLSLENNGSAKGRAIHKPRLAKERNFKSLI